ncbi:type II toxin-antitoxin system RelE/ParE family toxin [Roseibium sp. CAU 1637]|uniref:Type II toxin-antitoxin system RelE/ParE family toxin n=1 Tax=Roseibium limicola TaxID=2816037 RepID=A0A939EPL7_9HYPH|nr:type II toxin-antitoxin system RelE/ParE family toxin [Roseibium limicola]MBO0346213.1 type II toxin-antitoxin system RelE/ParE family toxin [Roseibium limicola]
MPAARDDLREIGDYIARDNPGRALSFINEIEARLRQVADRPQSFPLREDIHAGLRSARHGRYLIFFRESLDTVEIVRVLQGQRDLTQQL